MANINIIHFSNIEKEPQEIQLKCGFNLFIINCDHCGEVVNDSLANTEDIDTMNKLFQVFIECQCGAFVYTAIQFPPIEEFHRIDKSTKE